MPFDRDKLARSVRIALRKRPVQEERIERIVNGIVRQLEASGETDIHSQQIGELVMETLKEVDAVAYVRFASVYRNFREAKDFEAFLGELGETHIAGRDGRSVTHARGPGAWRGEASATAWPNPSVGCVIVRDGRVVGRALTAPGGRPHAEPLALAMAGRTRARRHRLRDAGALLHPWPHAPCTDALIAAGVARVVIAARDPDPRVNGAGIARLRAAGIVGRGGRAGGGGRGRSPAACPAACAPAARW